MAGPDGYGDDVAVVAVRPAGTTPACHVDAVPAIFTEMADARRRLRDWLGPLVTDPEQTGKIVIAFGEALANAIEHGSRCDPDRVVGIEAFADGETVKITVSDSGDGLGDWVKAAEASRSAGRGHGLTLIHGLADDVQTVRSALGTRVTITCRTGHHPAATRR
jgi:anti-sigma regulatory factor (Ser/Thr protein kinase)